MNIEIIVGVVIVAVALFFVVNAILSYLYRGKFPLNLNKRILSVDEQNFLKCLERALGDEYYIMPKVRFLDISHFSSSVNMLMRRLANKKINAMCADFLLCEKKDLSILGVVELEKFDKLITSKQKQYREKIIGSICRNLDIQLFYFDGRQDYSGMDIYRLITGKMSSKKTQSKTADNQIMALVDEHSLDESVSVAEKVSSCPKCYSEVFTKIAMKGDKIGEKFLRCRKYPYCDYQISVKDVSIKDIERKEEASRKKAGYQNW